MDSFSEIIQTMGAMVIFSLILSTTNRIILTNTSQEVKTETEAMALTLAQNIIEEAQTKPFDANTANGNIPLKLPEGFSDCGPGGSGDLNDFDDYDNSNGDGYSKYVDTKLGADSFHVEVNVVYVSPDDNYDINKGSTTDYTFYKKMLVTVTSDYLKGKNKKIQLSYLRRYYKTQN